MKICQQPENTANLQWACPNMQPLGSQRLSRRLKTINPPANRMELLRPQAILEIDVAKVPPRLTSLKSEYCNITTICKRCQRCSAVTINIRSLLVDFLQCRLEDSDSNERDTSASLIPNRIDELMRSVGFRRNLTPQLATRVVHRPNRVVLVHFPIPVCIRRRQQFSLHQPCIQRTIWNSATPNDEIASPRRSIWFKWSTFESLHDLSIRSTKLGTFRQFWAMTQLTDFFVFSCSESNLLFFRQVE